MNVSVVQREAVVTIRNMDGTMKVNVPQLDRKIKVKDLIKKIADTGELKKNSTKANSFRKTVSDILRLLSIHDIHDYYLIYSQLTLTGDEFVQFFGKIAIRPFNEEIHVDVHGSSIAMNLFKLMYKCYRCFDDLIWNNLL